MWRTQMEKTGTIQINEEVLLSVQTVLAHTNMALRKSLSVSEVNEFGSFKQFWPLQPTSDIIFKTVNLKFCTH
jgi:hypothetical protein